MEPSEMNMLNPIWCVRAQSRIAEPRAPLCEINVIGPGSGIFLKNVALRPIWGLMKPKQFWPQSPHTILLLDALYLLLELSTFLADLPETSRYYYNTIDANLSTLLDNFRDQLRWNSYYREVNMFRNILNARIAL